MYRKIILVSIMMSVLLAGCQEVEKTGQDVPEKKTAKVEIERKVDFSNVYSPSEVSVYSASLWEAEDDYIVSVFLNDKKVKKIPYATCVQYAYKLDTKDGEVVNIHDGGESLYGHKKYNIEAGVDYACEKYHFNEWFPECEKTYEEYYGRGKIVSKELDEKDDSFVEAKREVTEYLEKLHMENYAMNTAAIFEKNKKKGCLIYWTQVIDKIPVSEIVLDKSGTQNGTTVYNSKLNYNMKMVQRGSMLQTEFINERLVRWSCTNVINVERKLKQFPVVSLEKAYGKVEEETSNYPSDVRKPILEMAELQYKIIELDGEIYLYPVWTFCVSTEKKKQKDADIANEETWTTYNYFVIDAVTGDYFTDIDKEKFKN